MLRTRSVTHRSGLIAQHYHSSVQCLRCLAEIDPNFRACPHCGEAITDFLRTYSDTPIDGKYRILQRLGAGGMGEVYKVEHVYLGATRVIKVIRAQISGSKDANDRFLREARVATKVQHPNVATLHDFSALPDGSHYMVWEYIDGENLAERLRSRGTLPPRDAVRLAIQTLHGLEAIHRAGIVHRDISPENLMIARDTGAVKIIDLGVAKLEDASETAVTRTGIFVGKLRYASPEQLGFLNEGEKLDTRTDLYSLGLVLYEMLAGRPPFEAKSPHEYLLLHSRDTNIEPIEVTRDLPGGDALQNVLKRALARDRNKRFQNAADFARALEEVEKALPDLDATMRVREKTSATTVRETLITSSGAPAPSPAHRSRSPIVLVIVIVVLAIGVGILATMLFIRPPQQSVAPAAAITPPSSQTTVDVVTASSGAPAPPPARTGEGAGAPQIAPVVTHTVAPTRKLAVTTTVTETVPPPPVPAPQPVRVEEPQIAKYIEGGDGDANEPLLANLRSQLRGVTRINLQAGAMQNELAKALKETAPSVSIADNADVIVRFDGVFERIGRGRKRRAAQASVIKNGRLIFRYEMPSEEYRVGATPVEAFSEVLGEAFK